MPKISVVMSVYNGEKYLRQAIESILDQTFKDFEFIIINDSSTDNSLNIINSYTDSRIKLINNETNIGLTKSLNIGIKQALGEYIARMDADDISLPQRLEKQIEYMDSNQGIVACGTFARIIDENSKIIDESRKPVDYLSIIQNLSSNNCFTHGSMILRRRILDEIGYYNENILRAQDYDLWLRISEKYPMSNLPEFLYSWRKHNENIEANHQGEQNSAVVYAKQLANERKFKSIRSLAVCILFYEKVDQTIECLESIISSNIPVYILNNNSSMESRQVLGQFCQQYPQVKIFDSIENIGVSKGRNFLIKNTNADWLFFLDNDIFIKTENWLSILQKNLEENYNIDAFIPSLYSVHDKITAHYKSFEIIDNKFRWLTKEEPLINYFPGGAAIINRNVFNRFGLYDEEMFVGYEDYELAIRAYKKNMPIRAKVINEIQLIHEHRFSSKIIDHSAAAIRYDYASVKNSYDVIVKKHGIYLDDNFAPWLTEQINQARSINFIDYKKNYFSQNGEDGIINKIFEVIGEGNKLACEFGAWDGIHFSNSRNLILHNWSAIFIEGDKQKFEFLQLNYLNNPKVSCINKYIDIGENKLSNVIKAKLPNLNLDDIDLLIIDIDGLDYEIFNNLDFLPRVICIEVNAGHNPLNTNEIERNVAKDIVGQSLGYFCNLAADKGYGLVCYNGNAFFIKREILKEKNLSDISSETAYLQFIKDLSVPEKDWLYLVNLGLVTPYYKFRNKLLTRKFLNLSLKHTLYLFCRKIKIIKIFPPKYK